ncbi:MAG: RNA polymerase sigma-70 factor [Flammeovirgaceae bacterium]|nr:RNA polymerase sigma-70 factor [Flammeovirgaceae bacterium]
MLNAEFVEKLRAGDLASYKQVFDIYYKDLLKYANRFLNDIESSRDLVQEVYCYMWEKRSTLSIESSLDSYLFRAVRNACINQIKRNKLKVNYIQEFMLRVNSEDTFSIERKSGYDHLVEQDLKEMIESIVESLPVQCGNIFKLSRFKGLKNQEIADMYNISVRTVETQIFKAVKVFREKLQHILVFLFFLKNF